jgi:hypothetical protein
MLLGSSELFFSSAMKKTKCKFRGRGNVRNFWKPKVPETLFWKPKVPETLFWKPKVPETLFWRIKSKKFGLGDEISLHPSTILANTLASRYRQESRKLDVESEVLVRWGTTLYHKLDAGRVCCQSRQSPTDSFVYLVPETW